MARSSLPQARRCGQHCPSSVSTRSRVPGPLGPLDSIDQRLSGRDVFVITSRKLGGDPIGESSHCSLLRARAGKYELMTDKANVDQTASEPGRQPRQDRSLQAVLRRGGGSARNQACERLLLDQILAPKNPKPCQPQSQRSAQAGRGFESTVGAAPVTMSATECPSPGPIPKP